MSHAKPAADLKQAALKSLYDDLYAKNMFPFWATQQGVEHDEIKQLMGSAKGAFATPEEAIDFVRQLRDEWD